MRCINEKDGLAFLVLSIIFSVLTFIGAGFVLINHGTVNAGYTCIPLVFALVFIGIYRNSRKEK